MFRTLRSRAGILSASRLPLRVHAASGPNVVPVERVRFTSARPRPRAFIASIVTFAVLYELFTGVVFSPLDNLALDTETAKELDEQGGSVFIPFPGTIKQVQPLPYRGSDPEWQEYVKFSKDPALGKRIRDELAIFIQHTVEKHPVLTMKCGKDITLRRYWLDVDFPPTPPPEFERSGIEITDDYVAWTTMPVDSLTVFRIRQALWPSALTRSLWSFSKVLFWHDTSAIGGMLGIRTKPQPSVDAILSQAMKRSSAQADNSKQPADQNAAPPTAAATRAFEEPHRPDPSRTSDKSTLDQLDEFKKKLEQAETLRGIEKDIKDNIAPLKLHLYKAYMAFKLKFAQSWRPAPDYPPRGSILVSGLVELDSPKAWLVIDVRAAWDPKTKQYDARSMQIGMRRLQMKRQAPIGL